jgi:orotate phosphoribosyltransferase
MHEEVVNLIGARRGHFRYESGHHGDLWLELDGLYLRPNRLRPFVRELARRLAGHRVEAVCGPMVGGALLAQMVAQELDAELYVAEQFTRPTGDGLFPVGYKIPDALRPSARGKATAVVDDVINAGSAVRGAFDDLKACGARVVVLGALMTLGDRASNFAAGEGLALESLARMPNTLWEPSACPLCASGAPLAGVARPSLSGGS